MGQPQRSRSARQYSPALRSLPRHRAVEWTVPRKDHRQISGFSLGGGEDCPRPPMAQHYEGTFAFLRNMHTNTVGVNEPVCNAHRSTHSPWAEPATGRSSSFVPGDAPAIE
jgi:hypothetical protein